VSLLALAALAAPVAASAATPTAAVRFVNAGWSTADHRFTPVQVWIDGRKATKVASGKASLRLAIRSGRHTFALSKKGSRKLFLTSRRTLAGGSSYTFAVTGPSEPYTWLPTATARVKDHGFWFVEDTATIADQAKVRFAHLIAGKPAVDAGFDAAHLGTDPAALLPGAVFDYLFAGIAFGTGSVYVPLPVVAAGSSYPAAAWFDVRASGSTSAYGIGDVSFGPEAGHNYTVYLLRYVPPEVAIHNLVALVVQDA
jgi:hypothetical protein